mmetsp:Transcript_11515/g.35483  ORF Transcript_11515/g.35483 Transcript_11515/m.35483 type:complete len:368 (-) Transcript_11515:41-1144(-)
MALARVMLVVLLGLGSAFQGGALVRPTRSRARPSTRPPELPRSSLARSRRFAGARRALDAPARTPLRLEASEGTPDGWVCDAWLGNLVSVPRSLILRRIAGHLLFNVAVAAAFVRLRAVGWAKDLPGAAHSLTGAFLGLLVTFRTNNSYGRYWEARTVWGGIMNTCRSLAIGASVWITPRKPAEARGFVEALRRYPTQVAIQCRKEPLDDGDHPADVCMSLQNWLHRAAPPSSETAAGLYELQLAAYSRHVDRLTDATGALNKIISTPLPISYSRHTSRALSIWCGTLPCAIGSSVGPTATIVVVALVSWLVLGISAVGELLEQPFSQPENVGEGFDFGLPVESLGRSVADEIERLGTREGGALAAG